MIVQILLQLVLPVFLLAGLWTDRSGDRMQWLLKVLAAGAVLLFVFLTARWDFTSYYLRFAWPLLLVLAAVRSFLRIVPGTQARGASAPAVNAALFLGFMALNAIALRGHVAPGQALQLAFPLAGGTYYVGGGGNARLINNHRAHRPQRFGLDIVRLTVHGNRARALVPGRLEDHAIYGDTVHSPCAGRVLRAVDGLPDLLPPERDTVNLAGNHVVLECAGVKVVLAHLRQGSIAVAPGADVQVGAVLAQVGNSGNTSQPHLHMHAERGGDPDGILTGEGVPIELDGRFLVRNSIVVNRLQ